MRLIDADKLRMWFESHSVWDEFPVGYIMGLIDEQPTVDAIPVEWIRKYTKDCDDRFAWDVFYMVQDWQKEQRKEE